MLWLTQTDVRNETRPWKTLTRTYSSYVTRQSIPAELWRQIVNHLVNRLASNPRDKLRMGVLINLVPPLANESYSVEQANSDLETMLTGLPCLQVNSLRSLNG